MREGLPCPVDQRPGLTGRNPGQVPGSGVAATPVHSMDDTPALRRLGGLNGHPIDEIGIAKTSRADYHFFECPLLEVCLQTARR